MTESGLIFQKLNQDYLQPVVDRVYENFNDTLWFTTDLSEKEMKQSILDRINHPEIFDTSIICVNRFNQVVAGYFCVSMEFLDQNQHKWKFHSHFEFIDNLMQLVFQDLNSEQFQKSLWGFFIFGQTQQIGVEQKLDHADIMDTMVNILGTRLLINGYEYIYSFQGLKTNKNVHMNAKIEPQVADLKKQRDVTIELLNRFRGTYFQSYIYINECYAWARPILQSKMMDILKKDTVSIEIHDDLFKPKL